MKLLNLNIVDFRNITQASLTLSPKINLISGDNGAGKTSILEAIHHLSTANSFKTRFFKKIIQFNKNDFLIRGELDQSCYIAIQKKTDKSIVVKINNQKVTSASELARYFPVQVIFDDIFNVIDCGPSVRRSFLDWGLFHVEPSYNSVLANYNKALSQRNRLLKNTKNSPAMLAPWEQLMIDCGLKLHEMRAVYIEKLLPEYRFVLKKLNETLKVDIKYHHGWGQSLSCLNTLALEKELNLNRAKDFDLGYSSRGAHRSDLRFYSDTHFAKDTLSRGQQKVALIALKIAQGNLLSQRCLYLIDDLAAELDSTILNRICCYLERINAQVVITTLDPLNPSYTSVADKWFSMDKGTIKEL